MGLHDSTPTAADVAQQIGKYGSQNKDSCLSKEGLKELHSGISQYEAAHKDKVNTYKAANGIPIKEIAGIALNDSQFFRKQFVEYLHQNPPPQYKGDPHTRTTHPETATISMDKLLGLKGRELYHLALEEEMHSREFRHAVVVNSTTHFDGSKWKQRPVVIVSGPSGCGKSYAAQSAVETADKFLPIIDEDKTGNNVIAVDGGIAREVSQMRKLAIQIANNNGFSGIQDLHAQSKALEKTKKLVQEAAFATPDVGIVIPETFSKWSNPFTVIKNLIQNNLMKRVDELENTKQIFVRVDGKNPSTFQKVVGYMGDNRAWAGGDFEPSALDLNKTGLSESKAYGASGFSFGVFGSKLAEWWYRTFSKNKLSMIITNDLILLKPNPERPGDNWIPAEQGDEGAKLISDKLYNAWNTLAKDNPSSPRMIDYCTKKIWLKPDPDVSGKWLNAQKGENGARPFLESIHNQWLTSAEKTKPDLEDYHRQHTTTILTSAQIDLAMLQKRIDQRLERCEKVLAAENQKVPTNDERITYLLQKRDYLYDIKSIDPKDLETREGLNNIKNKTEDFITMLKAEKTWGRTFFSATLKALENISGILDKASNELQKELPVTSEITHSYKTKTKDIEIEREKTSTSSTSLDAEETGSAGISL